MHCLSRIDLVTPISFYHKYKGDTEEKHDTEVQECVHIGENGSLLRNHVVQRLIAGFQRAVGSNSFTHEAVLHSGYPLLDSRIINIQFTYKVISVQHVLPGKVGCNRSHSERTAELPHHAGKRRA